ncbi:hypothetical protein BGZ83_001089 [Gryganskiella cystojenkinii]|nr:hypothetical protein BGZ83_001089 [Gryganskiella cystojenkinii]
MAITEHLAGAAPSSTSCRGKEASTGDAISSLVSLEFTCPAPLQPSPPHPWMQQEFPTHSTSNISGTRPRPSQASRFFQTLPSTTLEEISIFEAYHLNHADILTLVERAGANLKSLKLDHARAIESETLKQVLSSCPRLEILTIPRAHRLTDAGVMQFVEANCAKSLVELDLSSCVGLTDECLTKLARGSAAVATAAARTLSLTSTIDRKGKGVAGTGDNKDKEAEHDHSLFPNLRRLDLSYNENMTLSGIIPLVMSLKNLCALDVSFCGDGVTTTWSSSLEALRPILNPTSDTEPEDSMSELIGPLQQGRIVEESEEDMDESGDAHDAAVEELGAATASQELSSHTAPTVLAGNTSPDVAAELTPISPIHSPGRHGLGGYSGPRLRSTTVTAIGHPVVTSSLPITTVSEGLLVMEDSRRRSSASSISSLSSCASDASTSSSASSSSTFSSVSSSSAGSSSTCCSSSSALSYSWVDTVSFAKGQSSNSRRTCALAASTNGNHEKQHHYHCRRRNSSLARIQLTARFDVLEVVPRRVGYGHGASYHLNSWFTPHHQQQLLQLFQIQVRQQHNLLMHQQRLLLLQQHQQYEQAATTVGSYDPCCDNDTILDTCDGHAATNFRSRGGVSVEEEAAAVLLELNEVLYLNTGVHPGQDANPIIHHNNNNNRSGRGGGRWRPNAEGTNEAAAGTGREGERGKGGIGGVDLARDYPGRHSINRRRTNLVAKGIVSLSGQCEISAWGLSLLKEEWSLV